MLINYCAEEIPVDGCDVENYFLEYLKETFEPDAIALRPQRNSTNFASCSFNKSKFTTKCLNLVNRYSFDITEGKG